MCYMQSSRQPTSYYAAPAGPAMPAALPAYVAPAPVASSSYGMASGSYGTAYSSAPSTAAPQQSAADALASVKVSLGQQGVTCRMTRLHCHGFLSSCRPVQAPICTSPTIPAN